MKREAASDVGGMQDSRAGTIAKNMYLCAKLKKIVKRIILMEPIEGHVVLFQIH